MHLVQVCLRTCRSPFIPFDCWSADYMCCIRWRSRTSGQVKSGTAATMTTRKDDKRMDGRPMGLDSSTGSTMRSRRTDVHMARSSTRHCARWLWSSMRPPIGLNASATPRTVQHSQFQSLTLAIVPKMNAKTECEQGQVSTLFTLKAYLMHRWWFATWRNPTHSPSSLIVYVTRILLYQIVEEMIGMVAFSLTKSSAHVHTIVGVGPIRSIIVCTRMHVRVF